MGFINKRKAQIAIEFVLVVGLAMVVLIVFAGVIYYLSFNYSEEKNINRLTDLGYSLQNELILASEVEPGYERTIIIPNKIGGINFSINQTDNDLVITYRSVELLFTIPQVNGKFDKGTNKISKTDANTIMIS
ncbi:hypothetical protein KY348_01450 [Candidatus Woesearchaeota archaeon]|nr:hypothetical protein [Candidatus Woesearchaeota archaeon]